MSERRHPRPRRSRPDPATSSVEVAGATGLVHLMGQHGIPEPLARAYLVTARDGPLSASELAQAVGIHRVEAYRTAQGLVARGLVAATGRPREYRAISVEELLERFEAETHRRLHHLQQNRSQLLRDWHAENIAPGLMPDSRRFQLLEGRPAVTAAFVRLMGLLRREVRSVLGLGEGVSSPDPVRFQAARDAQQRGVRMLAVTEVRADQIPLVQRLASLGDIRHVDGLRFPRYYLMDGVGLLGLITVDAFHAGSGPKDEIAFYTTDPAIVKFHQQNFRRLWNAGTPLADRISEISPPKQGMSVVLRGQEADGLNPSQKLLGRAMDAFQVDHIEVPDQLYHDMIGDRVGNAMARLLEGQTPNEILTSLERLYSRNGLGRVEVKRHDPLTITIHGCRACGPGPHSIPARVCESVLRSILTARLGSGYRIRREPAPRGSHRLSLLVL